MTDEELNALVFALDHDHPDDIDHRACSTAITTLRAQLAEQIGYKNDYKAAFIETNDDWQEAKARADRAEAALAAQIEVDAEIADRAAHHAMRYGMCYAPDGRSTAYHTVMDQPHDRTALDRYREKVLREAADAATASFNGFPNRCTDAILALIEKPITQGGKGE